MLLSSDGAKILSFIVGRNEKWGDCAEIGIWEADTGSPLVPIDMFVESNRGRPLDAMESEEISPALSPDGVWVAYKGSVFDTRNGKRHWLNKLVGQNLISSFSPDGTLLGSGVRNWKEERSSIQIRDTSSWNVVRTWDSSHSIKGIAFSPDGKWIAGAGDWEDGVMTVWDAMTGKVRSTLPVRGRTVAWSPDGNYFTANNGFSLQLVDTGHRLFGLGYKGSLLKPFANPRLHSFVGEETGFERTVRRLFTSSVGSIYGWHVFNSTCPFSPDGTRLIACNGHTLWVVDAKTGVILTSFDPYPRSWIERHIDNSSIQVKSFISTAAFSPDGLHILTGINTHKQPEIRMWQP
jgi:hypothetical protein